MGNSREDRNPTGQCLSTGSKRRIEDRISPALERSGPRSTPRRNASWPDSSPTDAPPSRGLGPKTRQSRGLEWQGGEALAELARRREALLRRGLERGVDEAVDRRRQAGYQLGQLDPA